MTSEFRCRTLSIIVPVHDEEWCIIPLYDKVMRLSGTLQARTEIIYVNDGSTDHTRDKLNELAERDQRVKVIHLRRNMGITDALMAGIDHASGDVIVTMDGNLQNEPQDIPRLVAKLEEGHDVCSGWRQESKKEIIKRRLPNRFANYVISLISNVKLHDYECSLKAYRRGVLQGVKLYGEAYRFIPVYAYWQGARVCEVPVKQYPRAHGHGSSDTGFKRAVKMVLDLILLKFRARYADKPMYVFGVFGLVSFGISLVAGCMGLFYKFFGDKSFIETPLPLLFVMAFISGGMCILMGFLAEIVVRVYYESQDKPVYLIDECRNLDEEKA